MVNANTLYAPTPPKLLDQVRGVISANHYSIRIDTQYSVNG
jgi:hypothetical protein